MCAHCTCMAGVGEVCLHVTAVLVAAEGNTLIKREFNAISLHGCQLILNSLR